MRFRNILDDKEPHRQQRRAAQQDYARDKASAFYAQGNTKLPTLAGIISFATNIILVLILIKPMSGNGIALALSLASFINTIFLFIFMKKMEAIEVKKVIINTIIYILKILILSVIAAIPCYFLRPVLLSLFENHGRLIAYGAPVLILAIIYFTIGVLELIITKDEITKTILNKLRKSK